MPPNLRIKPEARAIMAPEESGRECEIRHVAPFSPNRFAAGGGQWRGEAGGAGLSWSKRLATCCATCAEDMRADPFNPRTMGACLPVAEPPRVHVQAGEAPEPPEGDSDERPRGGGAGRLAPGEEVGGGGRAFVGGGDPLHGFEGDGCLLLLRGVGGVLLGVTVWDLETV
eukprot:CAMPEP_0180225684 /NCGR_PEP_ID=MMETSP0987-20121128/22871_1 /TAXON_ID=697907 /ORGANISM="non described non described, Strain CCMP2293" /LENGTH=169 /DNA_ID=CAMNT_0022188847 /DNA_START=77 /DNA_END=587 /DNA_ORIENTATION=+